MFINIFLVEIITLTHFVHVTKNKYDELINLFLNL